MRSFPPKDPTEDIVFTFDFTGDLPSGVLLNGVPTFTMGVASGIPDPNITSMPSGFLQINLSATGISQMVTGGIPGNTYWLTVKCPTTDGEVLALGGIVQVIVSYLQ